MGRRNSAGCGIAGGERVRGAVVWHWWIVMLGRNGRFMLHFKNFSLLKSSTVR